MAQYSTYDICAVNLLFYHERNLTLTFVADTITYQK